MTRRPWVRKLPSTVATALVVITSTLWTFWGIAELYYEGWGAPFPAPLAYLIPGAVCMALTLVVLTWPRVGGWLLVAVGGLFTAWWWNMQASRGGGLPWGAILTMFPVSGMLVLTGALYLVGYRNRRRLLAEGWAPSANWWLRNLHYVVGVGAPMLTILVVSAFKLPPILARVDDGDRGARRIEGNGVTLTWAPKGPGWNWKQEWGGYPSWDMLALYGVAPVGLEDKLEDRDAHATVEDMRNTGLCRYLSEDGLTLMDEVQGIWRMPTADEYVRSLVRRGENAGCSWNGEEERVDCAADPDKETPLWAPDEPPIYMWTADEYDDREAWYVSYNGWARSQSKSWGNPRHGYRCVRED